MKKTNQVLAAAGIALIAGTSGAFADCVQEGTQLVPPHRQPEFRVEEPLRGSPLSVLRQCLLKAARNEDISARDVTSVNFKSGYTSSSRGSFNITQGTAGQPGNDLSLDHKLNQSFASAVITGEQGVSQLENGNFAIVDIAQDTALRVYTDQSAYNNGAKPTVTFR